MGWIHRLVSPGGANAALILSFLPRSRGAQGEPAVVQRVLSLPDVQAARLPILLSCLYYSIATTVLSIPRRNYGQSRCARGTLLAVGEERGRDHDPTVYRKGEALHVDALRSTPSHTAVECFALRRKWRGHYRGGRATPSCVRRCASCRRKRPSAARIGLAEAVFGAAGCQQTRQFGG
jgi:hypothetical protein